MFKSRVHVLEFTGEFASSDPGPFGDTPTHVWGSPVTFNSHLAAELLIELLQQDAQADAMLAMGQHKD